MPPTERVIVATDEAFYVLGCLWILHWKLHLSVENNDTSSMVMYYNIPMLGVMIFTTLWTLVSRFAQTWFDRVLHDSRYSVAPEHSSLLELALSKTFNLTFLSTKQTLLLRPAVGQRRGSFGCQDH